MPSSPAVLDIAEALAVAQATVATVRPWARLALLPDLEDRIITTDWALRVAFTLQGRALQKLLNLPQHPGCNGCGAPTARLCDRCQRPRCGDCLEVIPLAQVSWDAACRYCAWPATVTGPPEVTEFGRIPLLRHGGLGPLQLLCNWTRVPTEHTF